MLTAIMRKAFREATRPPRRNAELLSRVVAWIDQQATGQPTIEPALAGYAWDQCTWYVEYGPGDRSCCVATATVLLAGYKVTESPHAGIARVVGSNLSVSKLAQRILCITDDEAGLLFLSTLTRLQLGRALSCFFGDRPVTIAELVPPQISGLWSVDQTTDVNLMLQALHLAEPVTDMGRVELICA